MTSSRRPRPSEPILHVDMDAFYASVEVLKAPSLAGKPVVVGSAGPRGVIMSASYEARSRGLHSAMPSVRAKRLCPEAVFVPPDFDSYRAYSNRFREILLSVSPAVEPLALDEAFVDVSGGTLLFGSPTEIGTRIRKAITEELSLTASVGIGPSKIVAKLASTRAKPDGLLAVPEDEVLAFLHPLPVDALWGIGEKTAQILGRLGIRTIGELAGTPTAILERVLGEGQSRGLLELASGHDDRQVVPFEPPKSVSHEETYPRDLDLEADISREILALSHRVAARLRSEGYRARTVTLKLRLPSFSTLTRSRTLPAATDVGAEIFTVARQLFLDLPAGRRRFRLIGVAATGLVPAGAEQLALVREGQWRDAERALDRVRGRFGNEAALPAALLHRPDRRP
ncbi:MAG TPA: DNA polymerase IV [Actinomycetota bacterium]